MERVCHNCGQVIPEEEAVYCDENGQYYCEDCADTELARCDYCGSVFLACHTTWYSHLEEVLCDYCRDNHYFVCADCGDLTYEDDGYYVDSMDTYVCECCYDDHYVTCAVCGEVIHYDDAFYDDWDYYCETCYPNGVIHEYGYKPEPIFSKLDTDKNPLYMGFELEVDNGNNSKDFSRWIADEFFTMDGESLLYCKHDSSLDCGFEIVSHPSTLAYYKSLNIFERISQKNIEGGYRFKSDQTDTCGLHVHVSRNFFENDNEQELNIAKIIILLNRFWNGYLANFTRRRGNYRWCELNTIRTIIDGENEVAIAKKCTSTNTRYVALNLENANTIEFRIFKGSLNPTTVYASLEFVDRICRYAKRKTLTKVLSSTWNDVFGEKNLNMCSNKPYAELIEYCKIREIYSAENRRKETTIPILKVPNGYHYCGETINLKTPEEIIEILSNLTGANVEYTAEGNIRRIIVPSVEGRRDSFHIGEFDNWDGTSFEIGYIGDRIIIHQPHNKNCRCEIDFSRDILDKIIAA